MVTVYQWIHPANDVLAALRTVCAYLWKSEKNDFLAHPSDEHIFLKAARTATTRYRTRSGLKASMVSTARFRGSCRMGLRPSLDQRRKFSVLHAMSIRLARGLAQIL